MSITVSTTLDVTLVHGVCLAESFTASALFALCSNEPMP